jgi:hypothetical protein
MPFNPLVVRSIRTQPTNFSATEKLHRKARKFSDLDLTIITNKPLDTQIYIDLKNAFSESDLPFKVEIID